MAAADPAERIEYARLAALSRWSKTEDRTAATQAARDALIAKYDPGENVPEPQRSAMIRAGLEAHLIRARLARRRRQQEREAQQAEELAEEILASAQDSEAS